MIRKFGPHATCPSSNRFGAWAGGQALAQVLERLSSVRERKTAYDPARPRERRCGVTLRSSSMTNSGAMNS